MAGSARGGVVAYGARDYAAQRAKEVEDENNRRRAGQANWNAMRTAQEAVKSGLGGTVTTYSDPYTGANYRYAGGGGGGSSSGSGSGGSGYGSLPPIGNIERYLPKEVPRQPMPAHVTPPPKADRTAAEAAAYGRAKDQIGQNAGGALKALQRQMSARGIRGSGLEAGGLSALIGTAQGQLGQVSRDQAIEGLKRDYQVEDRNYAGDLTQRTGDMGWLTTERGQDIDQAQGRASMIPALLRLMQQSGTGAIY